MNLLLVVMLLWAIPVRAQEVPDRPSLPLDPITQLPSGFVVAVVDGDPITVAQLDEYTKSRDARQLFDLNQQLYDLRQNMLGTMLGERLLKAEAMRRQQSVEELLEQVLDISAPTEEEIQEVYNSTPNAPMSLDVARPLIVKFLTEKRRATAREKYIQALIKAAKAKSGKPLVINLDPPRVNVNVASADPVRGSGAIELVEYADFECPYCQKAQPILKQLLTRYGGKVRHVWKDMPLVTHQNAVPAAIAARCAHEQGKFWEYHDTLFANQAALGREDLTTHAGTVGLDPHSFAACQKRLNIHRPEFSDEDLPARATPTVVINGRVVTGLVPLETYERIIEEELAAASSH